MHNMYIYIFFPFKLRWPYNLIINADTELEDWVTLLNQHGRKMQWNSYSIALSCFNLKMI